MGIKTSTIFEDMETIRNYKLPFGIGSGRTIAGDASKINLEFRIDKTLRKVIGKVKIAFHEELQGPPMHVHGGVSSYILDEAMGTTAFVMGRPGGATKLEFSLYKMVPFQKELTLEAEIIEQTDKESVVCCKLMEQEQVLVESKGVFRAIPQEKLKLLFKISPTAEKEFLTYIQTFKELNPGFSSAYIESLLS